MDSITTDQFAPGSLDSSPKLAGPDFGLISANEAVSIGNQGAIRDSIAITLTLSGTVPSNLLTTINNGNVGLSFGSPDTVPEPATSALLALPCLAGLFFFRRKQAVERPVSGSRRRNLPRRASFIARRFFPPYTSTVRARRLRLIPFRGMRVAGTRHYSIGYLSYRLPTSMDPCRPVRIR